MKFSITLICFFLASLATNAQSKKEQIFELNSKIDSLSGVITNLKSNNAKIIDEFNKYQDLSVKNLIELKFLLEKKSFQTDSFRSANMLLQKEASSLKKELDSLSKSISFQTSNIPFVGLKRLPEFWLAGEGAGQLYLYSIEIKSNADVYLIKTIMASYSDEILSEKKMYVGKFSPILKGISEFSPNEYYKITKNKFSIVDKQGNLLKLSGCCNQHSIAESAIEYKCTCEEQF